MRDIVKKETGLREIVYLFLFVLPHIDNHFRHVSVRIDDIERF